MKTFWQNCEKNWQNVEIDLTKFKNWLNKKYRFTKFLKREEINPYAEKSSYAHGTDSWVWKTQKWWNFHGTVQCYRLMLRIAVTLRSNFLYLVTSWQTALVTQWYYITMLRYMSVPTFKRTVGQVMTCFVLWSVNRWQEWFFSTEWLQAINCGFNLKF